ncbi:hypothetical protein [Escherichia coli]|uniref:hypothetical protein n=1 Tax=Escherichia coli TaxID=562 RepID=UPI00163D0F95
MIAFNIPDIYGRFHLVNFDNVKAVSVSDSEECGDLLLELIAHQNGNRRDLIIEGAKEAAIFVVLSVPKADLAKRGVI